MTGERFSEKVRSHFGVRNMSDEVKRFHEDFADSYGGYYLQLLTEAPKVLEEIPAHHAFFDDHGRRHSYRIIQNATVLLEELDHELTSFEKYVFASCAWLHDIGMVVNKKINSDDVLQDALNTPEWFNDIGTTKNETVKIGDSDTIRKWHHVLSWYVIRQFSQELSFPHFRVADIVADICKAHREKEDTSNLNKTDVVQVDGRRDTIHTESVAALFQICDALDVTKERAPQFSTEVMELPSESESHWSEKQLIHSVSYNSENKKIQIDATHKKESDKDLLEDVIADIYSEYKSIKESLASDPYPILVVDVVCHTERKDGLQAEVQLSGEDAYLTQVQEEGKEQLEKESSKFEELCDHWRFNVVNDAGDAKFERHLDLKITDENLRKRTHFVRCFDSKASSDWENKLRATAADGTTLDTEIKEDLPKRKRFAVYFPDRIEPDNRVEYSYEYEWNEFFPGEREEFEITSDAPVVEFELKTANGLTLEKVWVEEVKPDDRESINKFSLDPESPRERIEKSQKDNNVLVHWIQT